MSVLFLPGPLEWLGLSRPLLHPTGIRGLLVPCIPVGGLAPVLPLGGRPTLFWNLPILRGVPCQGFRPQLRLPCWDARRSTFSTATLDPREGYVYSPSNHLILLPLRGYSSRHPSTYKCRAAQRTNNLVGKSHAVGQALLARSRQVRHGLWGPPQCPRHVGRHLGASFQESRES